MIRVSTTILDDHKDWDIPSTCLNDMGDFERETAELREYLEEWDGKNDGGGLWWDQVENAILNVEESKAHKNLTLAMGKIGDDENEEDYSDQDIDVHVKWIEDDKDD